MSQVSIPTANSSSLPTGSKSSDKVGRESLHHYLIEAARTMRRVELGVGVTGWLCVLVIFFLAAILVDHWLWPLNTIARFAVLVSLVGWTVWWVPKRILPLLFQSIHPEHAARRIERQHPEMKESLISWLQLSTRTEHTAPRGVLATVGRFAVRNLGGQDSTAIIDSANLIRLAALLFGFLLTGTVYLFASPKSGTTSIARILMPWSNIAPAARVRIVSVAPGTTTITQGTILPISVTVRGMLKGDQVFVRYDLSDGQQIGQRLKMSEDIEGINYRLDFGKSFGGIHQPLSYWIDAGDASSGPFALSVQVVPIVAIDRIDFEYPKYTKQRPRTILQDGAIEAPEGTRVKLFAHANQPMAKSRLEFDPVVGNGVLLSSSQIIDLETQVTQLSGGWLLRLDKNGTNPTLSTYRVKATNTLNESNGDPVIYKIKVLGDLPPEVRLHTDSPSDKDAPLDVPLDGSQEIEMRGVDPDFGLVSLTASARRMNSVSDKEKVIEKTCFESPEGTTIQVVKVFIFKPSDYDLKIGDIIEFRAIAKDNRCKVGEDTPEPNEASSSPLMIRIVAAESKSTSEKDTNSGGKKEEQKADKNKNGIKTNKGTTPTNNDPKPDDKSDDSATQNEKQNSPDQSDDKQKNNKSNQKKENQKNEKSKDKGSGKSESGEGSASSDSEGSKEENAAGNPSNDRKGNTSKTKSRSSSESTTAAESGSEEDDESASDQNGTSSNTKNRSSSRNQKSSSNQDKDWDKPKDDAEAFERIDELRREREEKQTGEKQTGEKQTGEKQTGEKQTGEKQTGEKQTGEKQTGEKQAGNKQTGDKQAGDKQAGNENGTPSTGRNKEGASSSASATKGGGSNVENLADPANKEYADKVTDLALDYLKQQKDQPDPELLKRLKWTEEEMKKFLDRWTEAKEFAKTDPNKKRELDLALKTLGKRLFHDKEQKVIDRDDDLKGFLEEGARVRPPESVRTGFEQFRKAVGRQ